jgi:adenylate cyclase
MLQLFSMKRFLHHLAIGLALGIFLSILFFLGVFKQWNLRLSDNLFTKKTPSPDIAIIAIDDASIHQIGQWPWKRSVLADLIRRLGSNPAVIGVDITLSEPSIPEEDKTLESALRASERVVIPVEGNEITYSGGHLIMQKILPSIAAFSAAADTGLVNVVIDGDKVVRNVPVSVNGRGYETLEGFSYKIAWNYKSRLQGDRLDFPTPDALPLTNGLLKINFIGPPGTFPHYSFIDVSNGTISPSVFAGKIVLIGATALDLHDDALTPVSAQTMSGIEIQANAIQTLLDGNFLKNERMINTFAVIMLLSLSVALMFICFRMLIASVFSLIIIIVWVVYTFFSFDKGIINNMVFPPLTIAFGFIAHVLYKYFQETRQKRFIRRAFSYYLAESVLSEVLKNPKKLSLGGERKEITVLFSDIESFTSIAEKLNPELLSVLINRYLTDMTNIIFKYKGVLDKYIGDAVMAFWGAPVKEKHHSLLACQAALAMQEKVNSIRPAWQTHGVSDFEVRIGINTGEMIVGNMGSESRFDYTLLGDNVNLGARLESLNKEYGTHILISGNTYEQVKEHIIARKIDTVAVKGKEQGVDVYELRGLRTAPESEHKFLQEFEAARKLYQDGKFSLALEAFNEIKAKHPTDPPTQIYINRIEQILKRRQPPSNWDGIYRAHRK